jgi:hypothetical protein
LKLTEQTAVRADGLFLLANCHCHSHVEDKRLVSCNPIQQ